MKEEGGREEPREEPRKVRAMPEVSQWLNTILIGKIQVKVLQMS